MNNNKILRSHTGTFSCTLEGFDDSFRHHEGHRGNIFAICRWGIGFFGAEPAQPDAEMCTYLRKKEFSRRVEVRQRQGRTDVLRRTKRPKKPQRKRSKPCPCTLRARRSYRPLLRRGPQENFRLFTELQRQRLEADTAEDRPCSAGRNVTQARLMRVSRAVRTPQPAYQPCSGRPKPQSAAPRWNIVPGQPDEDVEGVLRRISHATRDTRRPGRRIRR